MTEETGLEAGRRQLNLPLILALMVLAGLAGLFIGAWWRQQEQPQTEAPASVSLQIAPLPDATPAPPSATPPSATPPSATPPSATPPSATPQSPVPQPLPPAATTAPAAAPPADAAPGENKPSISASPADSAKAADVKPVEPPSPPAAKPAEPSIRPQPAAPPQTQAALPPSKPPGPPSEARPPLKPVPDPALVAPGPFGPLPVIAPDGRQSWQVYARPFDGADSRPKVAVLIGDLGFSVSATNAAIERLPAGVTLAFAPYADDLQNWIGRARLLGHEVMLQLPMEPLDYPSNDPGPRALLTSLNTAENLKRLEWMLGRFTGYVGVTNYMGSKFTASSGDLRPVLESVRQRGLLFVDSRSTQRSVAAGLARELKLPFAANNRFVDNEASRVAIDARLEELERIARDNGTALGIGYPYPVTIERVSAWAAGLERKGLVLAPVSAVVQK